MEVIKPTIYDEFPSVADSIETAPDIVIGGVFNGGYDVLKGTVTETTWGGVDINHAAASAYDGYLKMHKVFVGIKGAAKLQKAYEAMRFENLPSYLGAAGSAAVEAALVGTDKSVTERLQLLEQGAATLIEAASRQLEFNEVAPECFKSHTYPYRLAMDIAVVPLMHGMISGDVGQDICRSVYEDCLAIAQANAVQLHLAQREGDHEAVADHIGFSHECNLLLAFNRTLSPTWFAIPSMARCDTGYEYRKQTHDLVFIHQKWGRLKRAIPTEVKATLRSSDKERYDALLVRGKMHLCTEGRYTATDTLKMLTAAYEGSDTRQERSVIDGITERLTGMARAYRAGERIGSVAANNTVTTFHDSSVVAGLYPGLSLRKAA